MEKVFYRLVRIDDHAIDIENLQPDESLGFDLAGSVTKFEEIENNNFNSPEEAYKKLSELGNKYKGVYVALPCFKIE